MLEESRLKYLFVCSAPGSARGVSAELPSGGRLNGSRCEAEGGDELLVCRFLFRRAAGVRLGEAGVRCVGTCHPNSGEHRSLFIVSKGPSLSWRGCLAVAGVVGQILACCAVEVAIAETSALGRPSARIPSSGMFSLSTGSSGAPSMNWNFFNLVRDGVEALIGGPVITGSRLSRLGLFGRSLALRARCHWGRAFYDAGCQLSCHQESRGTITRLPCS